MFVIRIEYDTVIDIITLTLKLNERELCVKKIE